MQSGDRLAPGGTCQLQLQMARAITLVSAPGSLASCPSGTNSLPSPAGSSRASSSRARAATHAGAPASQRWLVADCRCPTVSVPSMAAAEGCRAGHRGGA